RDPHPAIGRPTIDIGMRQEECLLLGPWRAGHAVDVMVAVALDMARADQRCQREVLLCGDPGLRGEILRRHEIAARLLSVPLRDTRAVDQPAIEPLARFGRDPAIAERARVREYADIGVRLVDLDRDL